jgi:hypothetical protein
MTVHFTFEDGTRYEVEEFGIGFTQETDHKGQPQHETRGGQIMLVLNQLVEESIYEWATNPFQKRNGTITFETELSNAPLQVEFFDAYCTKIDRNVSNVRGSVTTLVIAPEVVKLNGIDHDNFWKK